ncbi:MAG: hypothetical protein FJ023_08995 [Chloroflexi bacterium]|nr:hypothetical protein [Chloroflexota bacterium]
MRGYDIASKHLRLGLGLGLALALIMTVCFIAPTRTPSAHAGTMQWTTVDTPNNTGNVIISPSEIDAIAIGSDSRTFYAIDIPNSKVYKSSNGGITWDDLTGYLTIAGAVLPAWNIAIAPDNPNFVTMVTSDGGLPRKVFISTDGGDNWQDINCPVTSNIGAIAISPNYGGYDIAIGTRTGAGNGDVYIFNAAGPGNWASQGFTGDILVLKFSPNYRADSSLVTISAHPTGTYINIGIHDRVANITSWGNWGPIEITAAGAGTSPTIAQVITADIELPADFSGQAPSLRRMYVSIDAPTANTGIYRFDDTVGHLLMPTPAPLRISSIAYYGTYSSGKLLAGEVSGNANTSAVITWFTDAATTCQGTCWYQSQKAPTGGGNSGLANSQVIWSSDGNRAYCATSSALLNSPASWPGGYLAGVALDESALSLSLDNAETWNQLSLIDTEISFLSDVAVTPASDTIYLASINNHVGINNFDSIWRTTGPPTGKVWERVLCLLSTTNDLILRTSNVGNDPTIYLASRLTDDLRQSPDSGQNWNNTLPGVNVTDFAVTRINGVPRIYILDNNYIRQGASNGLAWQWAPKTDTTLNTGHSIIATPTGVVVVGDKAEGMIAYSLDGGTSFEQTPAIPEPGKMHVIADYRFQNDVIIYAASDSDGSDIYDWVIDSDLGWTAMGAPGRSFYGLAQLETLYGAWSSGGITAADRTLEPERLGPPYIEWDDLAVGLAPGVVFTREPVALKISAGINLWAIDNRPHTATTGHLWNFYDCFSPSPQYTPPPPPSREVLFQAPIPASPVIDEVIPIYLNTGDIGAIVFKWKHPTAAIEYELWLAKDEAFSQLILQQAIKPESRQTPSWTLPKTVGLEKGKEYYWKIRVSQAETGEKDDGQWSKVMSFSIASPPPEETSQPGPTPTTPPNGTVKETEPLPWTANLPLWAWITIAFLLVVIPVAALLVSRTKR